MGRKAIDLTGQRFNRLIVLERAENKTDKGKNAYWKCLCECGNEVVVRTENLKNGHTQSCGCLQKERVTKHGMAYNRIYHIWCGIKNRCFNPNVPEYKNYGGRGITMHPRWIDDFQAFYNYVSNLEHYDEDDYTLDRINNDGNYEPGNVRWADRKTQGRNQRTNVIVEYNGALMSLAEASELSGINASTLYNRYYRGDRGGKLFRSVELNQFCKFKR